MGASASVLAAVRPLVRELQGPQFDGVPVAATLRRSQPRFSLTVAPDADAGVRLTLRSRASGWSIPITPIDNTHRSRRCLALSGSKYMGLKPLLSTTLYGRQHMSKCTRHRPVPSFANHDKPRKANPEHLSPTPRELTPDPQDPRLPRVWCPHPIKISAHRP